MNVEDIEWTFGSALWQIQNGQVGTERTESAASYLREILPNDRGGQMVDAIENLRRREANNAIRQADKAIMAARPGERPIQYVVVDETGPGYVFWNYVARPRVSRVFDEMSARGFAQLRNSERKPGHENYHAYRLVPVDGE